MIAIPIGRASRSRIRLSPGSLAGEPSPCTYKSAMCRLMITLPPAQPHRAFTDRIGTDPDDVSTACLLDEFMRRQSLHGGEPRGCACRLDREAGRRQQTVEWTGSLSGATLLR